MNKSTFCRVIIILISMTILFGCSMAGTSPPPPPDAESITLTGETLNDGFAIQNSNPIMFGFNRERASSDSEISLNLPAGINAFAVTKDGAPGQVDGITDTTGSLVLLSVSNPGALTIFDFGESPGISLFVVTITAPAALPLGSCDWIINPSSNVDIRFARAIPAIRITCPAAVGSGSHGVILNAGATAPAYEGVILPVPSITSFAWTQTAGPAVTLTGDDTAAPSFDAPVVAADTDLTFQLTVTDDAGLKATEAVTIPVMAP